MTDIKSPAREASRPATNKFWLIGLICAALLKFSTWPNHRYALCSEEGSIYTVAPDKPTVQCLVVKGSFIESTGSLNAHAHILEYGFKMELQLDGATSTQDVVSRIRKYIHSRPDVHKNTSTWIQGMGWDQTRWPGAQFPTSDDLSDPMLEGQPIALRRVDGHALWVSSRVLEMMGELPSEVDGGLIIRDTNGQPTGIFVDNAMTLVPIPPWSEKDMDNYFKTAMADALAHGLTSIHDADSQPEAIAYFKKQSEAGNLPVRTYLMGNVLSGEYWGAQIPRLINHGAHRRLTVRAIKLFTDGALGSWGAALLEPYSDNPSSSGVMRSSKSALGKLVKKFYEDGLQVNIHCIGDRANNAVLDIFEGIIMGSADPANVTASWRPRIEHAQIMTLGDLERIGKLGVIASVQPTHATSDMSYAETRLGPERIKGAYAYQTLLQNSKIGVLPLGSDFPVEGINPLLGFYAAVSRLSVDGTSPHGEGGWFPKERLTRAQALKGMTQDAAYAAFAEDERGSLEVGKKADFVILDRDIMKVTADKILSTKVQATVIDGQVAYGAL
ncbi:amidohydrolase 3 [Pleurotus eryngii]|uniref:Amidohydrolase 3 n=1 Tax=Pleurotus eryngii TaxID=5323 RepID=A0A9P6D604_PLEER|nr:amidohydrolase 3 [Pleurotus eryngii]